MKRIIPALAGIALLLVGCSSGATDADTGDASPLYERHINLQDGREVTCIVYAAPSKGGVSCDWDKAK